MSTKNYITLEEILKSDATIDVYIKPLDKWVKIRSPTTEDRLEVEKICLNNPSWSKMSEEEQEIEFGRNLALRVLVEPKISYENFLKADDTIINTIIVAVSNELRIKNIMLGEQNKENIQRFLQVLKDNNLLSSLRSLESETLIGKDQQSSI